MIHCLPKINGILGANGLFNSLLKGYARLKASKAVSPNKPFILEGSVFMFLSIKVRTEQSSSSGVLVT